MNEAAILAEARGRLGDLTVDELPDAEITRAIVAGLRELSRYRPGTVHFSVTVQTGVADYALPTGTIDALDLTVLEVWNVFQEFGPEFGYSDLPTHHLGAGYWDELTVQIALDRLSRDFEAEVIAGTPPLLRLSPTPSVGGLLACRAAYEKPVTELTAKDCETLLLFVMGECQVYRGRRWQKRVRAVPTGLGRVEIDDGSKLRDEGNELLKEFRCRLGQGATFIGSA